MKSPLKYQRSQNFLDLNSRIRTNSPSRMLALVSPHKISFKLHRFESGPEDITVRVRETNRSRLKEISLYSCLQS